jgi:hypothetical protein
MRNRAVFYTLSAPLFLAVLCAGSGCTQGSEPDEIVDLVNAATGKADGNKVEIEVTLDAQRPRRSYRIPCNEWFYERCVFKVNIEAINSDEIKAALRSELDKPYQPASPDALISYVAHAGWKNADDEDEFNRANPLGNWVIATGALRDDGVRVFAMGDTEVAGSTGHDSEVLVTIENRTAYTSANGPVADLPITLQISSSWHGE